MDFYGELSAAEWALALPVRLLQHFKIRGSAGFALQRDEEGNLLRRRLNFLLTFFNALFDVQPFKLVLRIISVLL